MIKRIVITPGEPAGIGPDLCLQIAQQPPADVQLIVAADADLLKQRAQQLNLAISLIPFRTESAPEASQQGELFLLPVPLAGKVVPGVLNPEHSAYVLQSITEASNAVLKGHIHALVTGPVNKANINNAGFSFSGHTEFLAELCQQKLTVMMLATEGLRVALATTHLPLSEVSAAINSKLLIDVITILHQDLITKFGIPVPKILVCGLNPHAGEGGHLGREEIEIIEPVLQQLRNQGMQLDGPLPADTLFTPKYLDHADAVLAMYHDQGLPVLKFKGFGRASNITLGLPIIRTSVDHGTALDLAASGQANCGSLYHAIDTAVFMADHWRQR